MTERNPKSEGVSTFEIGTSLADREAVRVDVPRLIDSRALVTGMSGSGKSWLIRLLAERCGSQVVVIDPEGEFVTLAERMDVLIVGTGGKVNADPKTAGLLARRLLEFRISAVVDLSELEWPARRRWVRLFCEALLHAPRRMWTPLLVLMDEAHMFCPERSSGEAESAAAVIALASQGRKRGFGTVLATQRLSKLHKDASAELGNLFIGRITQDIDQKRAADALQLSREDRGNLKGLKDGQFWFFGPALTPVGPGVMKTADVASTHPKPGERSRIEPPAPSAKILGVLEEFEDLAGAAEEEARTVEELRAENAGLKRLVAEAAKGGVRAPDRNEIERAVVVERRKWEGEMARVRSALNSKIDSLNSKLQKISGLAKPEVESVGDWPCVPSDPIPKVAATPPPGGEGQHVPEAGRPGGGKQRILMALAQCGRPVTLRKLSLLTGLAVRRGQPSGTFGKYLQQLRRDGEIEKDADGRYSITGEGIKRVGSFERLPTGEALQRVWLERFGQGGKRRILEALILVYPAGMHRDELARHSGHASETSGTFGKYVQQMTALEVIRRDAAGMFCAAEELFET